MFIRKEVVILIVIVVNLTSVLTLEKFTRYKVYSNLTHTAEAYTRLKIQDPIYVRFLFIKIIGNLYS